MDEIALKLRILFRAQSTLFRVEAQRRSNHAILAAVSLGCVLVALIFVNAGLFFWLTDADIDSRAAFILAGGNLLIAAIPWVVRSNSKPSAEVQMVEEIREMAIQELTRDANDLADSVGSVGTGLHQLKATLAGGVGGVAGLAPLLSMAIELLKKRRD